VRRDAGDREWYVDILTRAVQGGFRHFDSAQMYGTEEMLGDAIRRLGVDIIDLFYVHVPIETYDPARTLPARAPTTRPPDRDASTLAAARAAFVGGRTGHRVVGSRRGAEGPTIRLDDDDLALIASIDRTAFQHGFSTHWFDVDRDPEDRFVDVVLEAISAGYRRLGLDHVDAVFVSAPIGGWDVDSATLRPAPGCMARHSWRRTCSPTASSSTSGRSRTWERSPADGPACRISTPSQQAETRVGTGMRIRSSAITTSPSNSLRASSAKTCSST
jgi:hypothetical protein